MRSDILDGKLKAGEKLGMHALQLMYSVGNSQIREALSRLMPEGLVEREDQKGFRVKTLSKKDLLAITKTRCWLEDIAIRESIRLGDTEWDESIVLKHHRLSREQRYMDKEKTIPNPKWTMLHEEFHIALISACDSEWLMAYCRNLLALSERYRRNGLVVNYQREAGSEHLDLMNATIDRDADTASRILQEHYRKTTDFIIEVLPDD
jgi:DNA-binding GntR family transcriptional regulator